MKRTCLRRNTNTNENSKHGILYDHKKQIIKDENYKKNISLNS
ncbi:hypothetical protein SAMN06265379_11531 [Saccharicrinis carchari]|uniref:Uncharacterized protein n=1 Tax=Saccharicrinis carchari TaxID=1168039 RepID=A0A521F8I3_SACCC|nr:hypothetical protein [Saccharicrinis carchari]SMO91911.1 hypothetical protein SAMN06265379_11531 [Saccharicrinis carchari]